MRFRMSLATAVVVFGCIFVCGGLYDLYHWMFPVRTLTGGAQKETFTELQHQIAIREQLVHTIKVDGHLTRESWDSGKHAWIPAGQLDAACVYEDGGWGRARVECSRDTLPANNLESEKTDRSFLSVFDGKVGVTLITTPGDHHEITVEQGRPDLMDAADRATGWRFTFLGRWIGARSDNQLFLQLLDNDQPDTRLTTTVNPDETFLTVRATRADTEDTFSIDLTHGYAFDRWEHRDAGHDKTLGKGLGTLHASMNVSVWWVLRPIYYPEDVEYIQYAADGSPLWRDTIHVASFTMDPNPFPRLAHVDAPAGPLTLRTPTNTLHLTGTAEENDKALQSAWDTLEK
jgi:hypothetical protein